MKPYKYDISICSAEPLLQAASGFTPFVSSNPDKRTNPAAVLPMVQSIVAIAVPHDATVPPQNEAIEIAELSTLGANPDYHPRVKSHLKSLAARLQQTIQQPFAYKMLVDSPTLDERAFAHRAGLGFFGKHGLLISPKFGTRFNIGLMLTDIPLSELETIIPPAQKDNAACPPSCNRCIAACPNGALTPGKPLNVHKCISYLTQKKELTAEEELLLHNQLYGCDICQNACPFNEPRPKTYINPHDWLNMTDCDFKEKYGHTSMLWQGAEILRRNAKIVCDNKR